MIENTAVNGASNGGDISCSSTKGLDATTQHLDNASDGGAIPAALTGLTQAEVAKRRLDGHVNTAPARSSRSASDILLANIVTPFNGLLMVLAAIVILVGKSPLNAAFGIVVIVNSGIGIFQELRAKRTLDKLAILSAPSARVIRDGLETEIAVDEVVLDDILHLRLGDQVVADGNFVVTNEIEIDESLLTGESDPIAKAIEDKVLSGSIVVAGSGYIHVTAVGADAYSSKIAAHAKRFQRTPSELIQSTNKLLKWISWMLVVVAPLLVWGQIRIDGLEAWTPAVIRATAAIVGMIPEGLVLLTSMAFMLAAMALARRNVLVQQMPAVEGLARVDTLLLDKTGTLTEGVIQYEQLIVVNNACNEENATGAGELQQQLEHALLTIANRAVSPTNDAIKEGLPDAKELVFCAEVPFSSARKWSSVTVGDTSWILGAPEILFANGSVGGASDISVSDNFVDLVREQASMIANGGKRVLVLMSASGVVTAERLPDNRVPQALIVLSEKVRDDARQTLGYFAEQGVDIKVISGDSPLTVAAIARQVGLDVEQPFDARDLPNDDVECLEIIFANNVFGRVQPEQKRRIAKLLQGAKRTVAMTGDGVNDALALKDADIGIAMNSGASATKAIAELVLMDNKFSCLPRVLAEGRRVIANIERVANLFIIKNIYSLVLSLAVTVAGQQYPFVPIQMTVISALTIGIPAFFLALAPNQQLYRPGFLKRVLCFAAPVGVISATAMMVGYVLVQNIGVEHSVASTSVSIMAMSIACWVLICLARPLKVWKIALIVSMALAFVALLNIPLFATLLDYNVDFAALPIVALVSLVAIGLVELVWRIMHRFGGFAGGFGRQTANG